MNNNLTFLTEEQVFGDNKLDIIKKYGTECFLTDFAILLGGFSSKTVTNIFNEKGRTGNWCTKTLCPSPLSNNNLLCTVDQSGNKWLWPVTFDVDARPALSSSLIPDSQINLSNKGIYESQYYEYPQTVVNKKFSDELEKAYQNGNMVLTGKHYTTASFIPDSSSPHFKFLPSVFDEYVYKDKKYIRYVTDREYTIYDILSDGRGIIKGKQYWVSVEPIEWLVDKQADIALSKKILFSGIPFVYKKDYLKDFSKISIYQFMNKYFSKEIISSPSYYQMNSLEQKESKNPYDFNFDSVTEEEIIKGAIESDIPVFLHGRSSEGKSARVKQIDPTCEIIYLRNATPDSLNGKSVYDSQKGKMIDISPSWLQKLQKKCEKDPDRLHVLFFDEITNALPSIQGMAFNIVLDREVNGKWRLPDNTRIVAAGNEMKESLAANQLVEPLFNRFAHVYIKTTTEKWLKWASENNIHPAIYSFIAFTNGEGLRSEYNGKTPNADPRKWEMASKILYKTGRPDMLRAVVGEDITKEFIAFCNQPVITLDDVIKENYSEEDIQSLNTAERYATTMGLSQVGEDNLDNVREFVIKLGEEFSAVFDSLWTHGDETRLERIAEAQLATAQKGGKRI